MTDYCAPADIVGNLKGFELSPTSPGVTSSTLDDMISQESSVIDQHVSSRYTLPVTDATALLFLKKLCIDLVVYRVTKVLQPKNALAIPSTSVVQDISDVTAYRIAMKMLGKILDGEMTLPGEEVKDINFFASTAVDCDETSVFDFSEQQW